MIWDVVGQLPKVDVAGSIPVVCSLPDSPRAAGTRENLATMNALSSIADEAVGKAVAPG
jgi:hypothetical protein